MQTAPPRYGLLLCLFATALGLKSMACAEPPPPAANPSEAKTENVVLPSPSPRVEEEPEPAEAVATSEPPPDEPATERAPTPESAPASDADEKAAQHPIDVLTDPGSAFLIDYENSDPAVSAHKACAKPNADDDAIAQCVSDARDAFKPDVLRFKKAGSHWTLVIYKRAGNRLDEVYSSNVALTEASATSVQLKFAGGERGARPVYKNKRELTIEVPNDYSLVLPDSELGRLSYEAKVGLVSGP